MQCWRIIADETVWIILLESGLSRDGATVTQWPWGWERREDLAKPVDIEMSRKGIVNRQLAVEGGEIEIRRTHGFCSLLRSSGHVALLHS